MVDLENKIGGRFVKSRFGAEQVVVLEEVRRDKVKLRELDHQDGFTLPLAKFKKFYKEA